MISQSAVFRALAACAFLCAAFVSSPLAAQDAPLGSQYGKPLYDPASKSYIELHKFTKADEGKQYIPSMIWRDAQEYASRRAYKGVRGRLVVITQAETHSLIRDKLRPSTYTWIGLRYFCDPGKLQWTDGTIHLKEHFSIWRPDWDSSGGERCSLKQFGYMPVFYTPPTDGLRWMATGPQKLYTDILIQYPTGGP
jgi:hypothetical protein